MTEWKEIRLNEICDLIAGYAFKSSDFGDYPIKVIRIGDIKPPFVDVDNAIGVNIQNYEVNRLSKFEIVRGDFILAMTGATIGKIGLYLSPEKNYINQRVLLFRPKGNINRKFIYYALNDKCFNSYIINHVDSESAQPNISAGTIGKYTLSVPSLDEQKKIAAILSSLDDKIETNRKINARLEELAQAIFKSWFIDFEPFGGKLPEDWVEGTLNEMVESVISGDWGKEKESGSYIKKVLCIRGADLNNIKVGESGNAPTRYIIQKNYNQKSLENHDIIVEISGGSPTQSTGRIAMISSIILSENNHSIICTNFCKVLKIKKVYNHYFYYLWNWLYDNKIMFIYENGSNGLKNLNLTNLLEREKCNIPSERTALDFYNVIEPVFSKIQRLGVESSRLAALRDTLLTKLMSGELIPE